MTLWELSDSNARSICSFDSSLSGEITKRLAELGIRPGEVIQFIRRVTLGGPVVLQVSDSIFSLEKSIAEKILLNP